MGKPKLTPAQRDELVAVAAQMRGLYPRWKLEYIAALYGVSIACVSVLMHRRGMRRGSTRMNEPLNDDDLEGIARRIADNARRSLEATDKTWVYMPSFRNEVIREAFQMLQTVVLHERRALRGGQREP